MDFLFLTLILAWRTVTSDFVNSRTTTRSILKEALLERTVSDECSDHIITDRKGYIISPMYPEQYPNHISCTWHIMGNLGEVISISFRDLDIEESGSCLEAPCCLYNWVKIGPSANGTDRQYCGQDGISYPIFMSDSVKVWIKFHVSSIRNGGRGFKLFFTVGPKENVMCKDNEFRCSNLECISQNLRCNGINDCGDRSDEKFCSELCPLGKPCRSVYSCYSYHEHCDGVVNCPDFSDEIGCGLCAANETRCGHDSDRCYNPITQRCNRILDCLNGVDEKDCLHGCPGQIMCASGIGCYTSEERCNGVAQCSDSSDEKNCGSDLCNYDHGGFLCGNGRCIREIWKCDRTNDCGDGSDEHNCLRNSVLTAAIMGSLICALLLIIAVSCTCRLYALRNYENQMSSQETVLPRLNQEFFFREPPPSYATSVGERHRSLCVENVHYNPCPRRVPRRIRRARRMRDSRPTVSTVENIRNPTNHCVPSLSFPCLSIVPSLTERTPSQAVPHTSNNRVFSSAVGAVVSGNSSTYSNEQNIQRSSEIRVTHSLPQSIKKNEPVISQDIQLSIDAESSFSELTESHTPKTTDENSQESSINGTVPTQFQNLNPHHHPMKSDNLTFQDKCPAQLVESRVEGLEDNTCKNSQEELGHVEGHCDSDMQPLLK